MPFDPMTHTNNVYFIFSPTGHVKIGLTNDVQRRFQDLQVASPLPLKLLGVLENVSMTQERLIHRHFEELHVRGEWYEATPKLMAFAHSPTKMKPDIPPLYSRKNRR